jgi:hypothetical protein
MLLVVRRWFVGHGMMVGQAACCSVRVTVSYQRAWWGAGPMYCVGAVLSVMVGAAWCIPGLLCLL